MITTVSYTSYFGAGTSCAAAAVSAVAAVNSNNSAQASQQSAEASQQAAVSSANSATRAEAAANQTTAGGAQSLATPSDPVATNTNAPTGAGFVLASTASDNATWQQFSELLTSPLVIASQTNSGNPSLEFHARREGPPVGDTSPPLAIQDGDVLGIINFRGYDGADYDDVAAAIYSHARGATHADTIHPGDISFHTRDQSGGAALEERMRIKETGRVKIGPIAIPDTLVQDALLGVRGGLYVDADTTFDPTMAFYSSNAGSPDLTDGDTLGIIAFRGAADNGSNFPFGCTIRGVCSSNFTSTSDASGRLVFTTKEATGGLFTRLVITETGVVHPGANGTQELGTSALRWGQIYSSVGTISTSDERLKNLRETFMSGIDYIKKIRPIAYTWKDSKYGTKLNYGFSANQIETLIQSGEIEDFGGYSHAPAKDENGNEIPIEEVYRGLNYSQFIAPAYKAIQELADENDRLKSELSELKATVAEIQASLASSSS